MAGRCVLVGSLMGLCAVAEEVVLLNCIYGYSQCLGVQSRDSKKKIREELGCNMDAKGNWVGAKESGIERGMFGYTDFLLEGSKTMPYQDGMPCTFSPDTSLEALKGIQLSDIKVKLTDGSTTQPVGATWWPAAERNEQRTLLMLGDFGRAKGLGPAKVTIKGSSFDGPGLRYTNTGEEIVWAKWFTAQEHKSLEKTGIRSVDKNMDDTSCQSRHKDVTHVVQIAFNGGMTVTYNDNQELPFPPNHELHKGLFKLTLNNGRVLSDEEYLGFVDEADGDNFIDLCLKVSSSLAQEVKAGLRVRVLSTRDCLFAVPPKGDGLNKNVHSGIGDTSSRPQEICVSSIPGGQNCGWNSAKQVTLTKEETAGLKNCQTRSSGWWPWAEEVVDESSFPMWLVVVFALPFVGVIFLWIRRRRARQPLPEEVELNS